MYNLYKMNNFDGFDFFISLILINDKFNIFYVEQMKIFIEIL